MHSRGAFLVLIAILNVVTSTRIEELWQMAEQFYQSNDLDSAMTILEHIETLQPGNRPVRLGIASIYQRRREFDNALHVLNAVLAQEPKNPELLQRMGEFYIDKRDIPKALEYLHEAEREIDPSNVNQMNALLHQLALAYHYGHDFIKAENFFNQASKTERSASLYFDFGVTLEKLGKIVEAGHAYYKALEIEPTLAQARVNVAALHHQYGNVNESIPQYLYVINLPSAPTSLKVMTMGNVGVAYEVLNDIVSALGWYERALGCLTEYPDRIFTDQVMMQSSRLHLMVHVVRAKLSACVWANAESEFDSLWAMVTSIQVATGTTYLFTPFDALLHDLSPIERKMVAMQFSAKYNIKGVDKENANLVSQSESHDKEQLTRLNVGYISYDYSDHPTTHLMEGIFATRDQESTKVVAFGYGRNDGSAIRQRIVETVDKFVDLSSASFQESAARIQEENVHLLMDAQGHTRRGRMEIIAARPAAIVVNYLVYPGTSGASFVDYVIVDKFVAPPAELASAFTEKLVVLPNCYQVNYYSQLLDSTGRRHRRAELWDIGQNEAKQRQDEGFVFVNFNKIDKLEVSVFSTWMAILRRVPRSSLVLLDPEKSHTSDGVAESVTSREIKKNLRKEARAQGVSSWRLRFVSRQVKVSKLEHLQRHRFGELFLDTFIYGAHSTATDALYAGLPVLTLAGDSFASRVGVSLLENLGMQELITFSRREYEDVAVYLATTPLVLERLRRHLQSAKIAFEQPLFQTKQHTQQLEASQRLMYDVYSLTHIAFHVIV